MCSVVGRVVGNVRRLRHAASTLREALVPRCVGLFTDGNWGDERSRGGRVAGSLMQGGTPASSLAWYGITCTATSFPTASAEWVAPAADGKAALRLTGLLAQNAWQMEKGGVHGSASTLAVTSSVSADKAWSTAVAPPIGSAPMAAKAWSTAVASLIGILGKHASNASRVRCLQVLGVMVDDGSAGVDVGGIVGIFGHHTCAARRRPDDCSSGSGGDGARPMWQRCVHASGVGEEFGEGPLRYQKVTGTNVRVF